MLSFGILGFTSTATASSAETLTEAEFAKVYEAVTITSSAIGLYTGDYQSIARSTIKHLYDGSGAAEMAISRLQRF